VIVIRGRDCCDVTERTAKRELRVQSVRGDKQKPPVRGI
jgi:hypothetical protein